MADYERDLPRPIRRLPSALHLRCSPRHDRVPERTCSSISCGETDADTIYLVGVIVDGWRLKASWNWPQAHNDVVQKLLRKVRKRVRLFYIPGNHDEFLRDYYGTHFGGIEVVASAIHCGADGKRYLIVHGDAFDVVVRYARRRPKPTSERSKSSAGPFTPATRMPREGG